MPAAALRLRVDEVRVLRLLLVITSLPVDQSAAVRGWAIRLISRSTA
jgi:hypothetical protein